jgi:hypothetical protein
MNRFCSLIYRLPTRATLLTLLVGVSLTGCGAGRGEVSGVVRYNGKPLPHGTIQFLGEDGIPYAGKIQPDGTFSVELPAGEAKVIVSCVDEARLTRFTSQMAASNHGRGTPPTVSSSNFSLIPQRYADWDASGLTVHVQRGKTEQDFDLSSN